MSIKLPHIQCDDPLVERISSLTGIAGKRGFESCLGHKFLFHFIDVCRKPLASDLQLSFTCTRASYYLLALLLWIDILQRLRAPTFFALFEFCHLTGPFLAASVISCILGGIVAACVGIGLTAWRSVGECAHGEGQPWTFLIVMYAPSWLFPVKEMYCPRNLFLGSRLRHLFSAWFHQFSTPARILLHPFSWLCAGLLLCVYFWVPVEPCH